MQMLGLSVLTHAISWDSLKLICTPPSQASCHDLPSEGEDFVPRADVPPHPDSLAKHHHCHFLSFFDREF